MNIHYNHCIVTSQFPSRLIIIKLNRIKYLEILKILNVRLVQKKNLKNKMKTDKSKIKKKEREIT